MNKSLLKIYFLGTLLVSFGNAVAQDFAKEKITNDNGSVSLVVFKKNAQLKSIGAPDIFKTVLKLKDGEVLKFISSNTDASGKLVDEKYQFFHNNIKVEGGVYNLHYSDGELSSMNGEIFQDESAASFAEISATTAFGLAIKKVGAQKYMWENSAYLAQNDYKKPSGELVYLPVRQGNGKYALILAYKFDIYAEQPISRTNIYVDALAGRIAGVDPIMKHANNFGKKNEKNPISIEPYKNIKQNISTLLAGNADTRYSGTQTIETSQNGSGKYILNDQSRGNGIQTYNLSSTSDLGAATDFEDNDNQWTAAEFDNAAYNNAALDAHWGIQKTYDYFKNNFNRNSFDNLGTKIKNYVHYKTHYEDASWTGAEMIFGDGGSNFRPYTSLDVTAHELAHGVCASTANLIYERESGAINESLSDIWAVAVENSMAPSKNKWLIGEEIAKVAPNYIRSLSDPKSSQNPQPDTYRGINWKPATTSEGCLAPDMNSNDYCGVHTNSGVLNHWFYILSVGKAGTNDLGYNYNVTGITIEKAAKIAYRLETVYLTPNSDFVAAKNYGIQAAKDLYGVDSPEAIATQNAFHAVGLGAKYLSIPDTVAPTAPTNLTAYNTTGTQTYLQWNSSNDENGIEKYNIYKNGVLITSVAGNKLNYTVTGLNSNTTYTFYIKALDPYQNISNTSNELQVTTLTVLNYCVANSSSTNDERIKRVVIGTIDNTSYGTDGYEDFTLISTNVKKNINYPITITPEWPEDFVYSDAYAVFIDWNNDGDFLDSGERAFSKDGTIESPINGNIMVPATAHIGPVRMRVIMRYNTTPTSACGTIPYGQVEDYTLNVQDVTLATNENFNEKLTIYPNPVQNIISIQNKIIGKLDYKIYNTAGQIVSSGNTIDKKINAEHLSIGSYILELIDKTGTKTVNKFIKK